MARETGDQDERRAVRLGREGDQRGIGRTLVERRERRGPALAQQAARRAPRLEALFGRHCHTFLSPAICRVRRRMRAGVAAECPIPAPRHLDCGGVWLYGAPHAGTGGASPAQGPARSLKRSPCRQSLSLTTTAIS